MLGVVNEGWRFYHVTACELPRETDLDESGGMHGPVIARLVQSR